MLTEMFKHGLAVVPMQFLKSCKLRRPLAAFKLPNDMMGLIANQHFPVYIHLKKSLMDKSYTNLQVTGQQ